MSQHEAADHLSLASVCIIPFVKNEFTKYIYPLKINEYLAMGKPVVTTNFADLSSFTSIASIAQSTEDFLKAISSELAQNTSKREAERLKFAAKNSWNHRATQLKKMISDLD